MKRIVICLSFLLGLFAASSSAQSSFDFSNINFWIGTGTNQSALVIDWNDGKASETLAWGYNWNADAEGNSPTALNMLLAIASADPRLLVSPHPKYTSPSYFGLYSIYFNTTNDGSLATVGVPGDYGDHIQLDVNSNPVLDSHGDPVWVNGQELGTGALATDHYKEGWMINGSWCYFSADQNPYGAGAWISPWDFGMSGRSLVNGSWDGLAFGTDIVYDSGYSYFTSSDPSTPVAVEPVPEPSSVALILLGLLGVGSYRKLRRS